MQEDHHVGVIVRSHDLRRVEALLTEYTDRVRNDFWAYAPARGKPAH